MKCVGNGLGEQGYDPGTERAGSDAQPDPGSPLGNATGGGEYDTDDETGLDHFPQHDDQSAEHLCYSAITTPLAVSEWNSPMNS